jgi:alkylation response protein AidB-like acyl-CoA dehydrogenase
MTDQVDGGFMGTLSLVDVSVANDRRIAAPGFAEALLREQLDRATLAAAGEMLGVVRKCFAMTLDYLKQREQFGRPIGSFQSLQHRAADLKIQIELTAASVAAACRASPDSNDPRTRTARVSRAKARASDVGLAMGREAIQLHGAIGYTDEYDVGLYVKRAMVLSAWLGNAARHRRRYAKLAFDEELDG